MTIRHINPGPRYSEAVIHGNVVYLAGQVGKPGDNVAEQTATALAQIEALLAEAGSDKSRLLMATIWLSDIGDYDAMNAIWDRWIAGVHPPARATSEAKLASADYLVEIIVVAALG